MTIYCANCHQVYSPRPIVDLDGNVVIWQGKGCSLGRRQADILHVLLDAPVGGNVLRTELARRVFGVADMAEEQKQLQAHFHFLRKKLARLGIEIDGVHGFAASVRYTPLTLPEIRELLVNTDRELLRNTDEKSKRTAQTIQRSDCRIRQRTVA